MRGINTATGKNISSSQKNGTATITAFWNGYTAESTVDIVDSDDILLLSMLSTWAYVDGMGGTTLLKSAAHQYGESYTVECGQSHSNVGTQVGCVFTRRTAVLLSLPVQ